MLLQSRRDELVVCPTADPKQIGAAVARMFLRYPSTASRSDPAMVAAYVKDLSGYPLWAIDAAISRVVSGHATRPPAFPPPSPELQQEIRGVLAPVLDEQALINRVLGATVITISPLSAEARRKIVESAKRLRPDEAPEPRFSAERRQDRRGNPREAAERRLAAMDYASAPITVSDELAIRLR